MLLCSIRFNDGNDFSGRIRLLDSFRDNFVIQYLIDFEVAIQFPAECSETERLSVGLPLGGSFTDPETYARPRAPECVPASGIAYSPFKLDVWHLGISF